MRQSDGRHCSVIVGRCSGSPQSRYNRLRCVVCMVGIYILSRIKGAMIKRKREWKKERKSWTKSVHGVVIITTLNLHTWASTLQDQSPQHACGNKGNCCPGCPLAGFPTVTWIHNNPSPDAVIILPAHFSSPSKRSSPANRHEICRHQKFRQAKIFPICYNRLILISRIQV